RVGVDVRSQPVEPLLLGGPGEELLEHFQGRHRRADPPLDGHQPVGVAGGVVLDEVDRHLLRLAGGGDRGGGGRRRRRPAQVGREAGRPQRPRAGVDGRRTGPGQGQDGAEGHQPDSPGPPPPHSGLTSGISTTNRAPVPAGLSSTQTRPPWRRTCSDTSDSPRPDPCPPPRRCPEADPRKKRSKMASRSSGATPGPSSSTATRATWWPASTITRVAPPP